MTFNIITLGCKVNQYESQLMSELLTENGFTKSDDKNKADMVWGIDDVSHSIIGTDKNLQNVKCQGQELESFLRVNLSLHLIHLSLDSGKQISQLNS